MLKVNALLNNTRYINYMKLIETNEIDRIFCKHSINHSFDVARIATIINLENSLGIDKETIYLSALLHDIGRVDLNSELSHHEQGAIIANEILEEIGCPKDDIILICKAIRAHKYVDSDKSLEYVLFKADKLSRSCYNCKAINECYWSDDTKNKILTY